MKKILFCLAIALVFNAFILLPSNAQTTRIVIATGGTGGAFYPLGAGFAKIIEKNVPGVAVTVQVTGGAVENVRLVNGKKATLGFGMADTPFYAYQGKREFEKSMEVMQSLRIVMAGHVSVCHIVTRGDSGIQSMKDLEGKKVSMGDPGGATKQLAKLLLEASGLKNYKPLFSSYSEQVEELKDGNISAGFIQAGVPTSSVIDLTSSIPTRLLSIDSTILEKVLKEHPYYCKSVIKAGTYKRQDKDVMAIGCPTHITANKDTSPELIYAIVKALFEHIKELADVHPAGREYSLKIALNAISSTPPLHPGAEKYYREKNLIK